MAGKASSSAFINEKVYMTLQIFLQNKCQPSIELVNLLSSDNFNINYLQALATKIALDGQGRLVNRETGKIILPFEHFANAVILKHMAGPNGMHLSMDATIKSVFESYSCGKENFGFDRDFIIEVVNSCPSTTCRYFKGGLQVPPPASPHQTFPQSPMSAVNLNMPNQPRQSPSMGIMQMPPTHDQPIFVEGGNVRAAAMKQHRGLTNQQFTQQMMQNRQQMESLEKQRVLQQLDKKHYETVAAIVQANNSLGLSNQPMVSPMQQPQLIHTKPQPPPQLDYSIPRRSSYDGIETYSAASYATSNRELLNNNWTTTSNVQQMSLDHGVAGQEKIVRAFAELMKNMAKMKAFVRPSMVKPYGKQSENLQKALMDSIQIVQSLRNFLPKPHISISSWKNSESEIVQIQ